MEAKHNKVIAASWLNSKAVGYTINVGFSVENQEYLGLIIKDLKDRLPDLIWPMPSDRLHITLFDWIASLKDYGRDKEKIFSEISEDYDRVLVKILDNQKSFTIKFNELKITQDAIIAIGTDNGSFDRIRKDFFSLVSPVSGSNPPPNIIHTTLCRFKKEESLDDVISALDVNLIPFEQEITNFKLHKVFEVPMIRSEIIKDYILK